MISVVQAFRGAGSAGSNSYSYDANGNMTSRPGYTLVYNAENRLQSVSGAATASFVYDGDGGRLQATFGNTTTYYIGNHYEFTVGSGTTRYYMPAANGWRCGDAEPLNR